MSRNNVNFGDKKKKKKKRKKKNKKKKKKKKKRWFLQKHKSDQDRRNRC